jgi:hypothetical protein
MTTAAPISTTGCGAGAIDFALGGATDFAFAAYWLMPRLHRFHQANPQVDVSLVTSERNHATLRSDIDVAVLFGDGRFKQGESLWLFNEEVFPVCSPQWLKEQVTPLTVQNLHDFPLLHLRQENNSQWFDWSGVFRELGISAAPTPGQLRFDNYTLLIQAAIVEVSGDNAQQLGVQWAFGSPQSGVGVINFSNAGSSLVNLGAAALTGDPTKATLGEGAAIAVAMIPFLLAAILFSFFGLQRRKWQQGQD